MVRTICVIGTGSPVCSTAFMSGSTFRAKVCAADILWSPVGTHQDFPLAPGLAAADIRSPRATLHKNRIGSASRIIRSIVAARSLFGVPVLRPEPGTLPSPLGRPGLRLCLSVMSNSPINTKYNFRFRRGQDTHKARAGAQSPGVPPPYRGISQAIVDRADVVQAAGSALAH